MVHVKSLKGRESKKVILIVADSLMPQAIKDGLTNKKLPAFQYLIEHGQYYSNMVSSFPTMSVTIDSSLLTGAYPDDHRIPGLTWYSTKDQELINYGTGPLEVATLGIDPVLTNAVIHLNGRHLNPQLPTIYEDLARLGRRAGSINGLIYRGTESHTLSPPAWMHAPTSLPKSVTVKGPDFLALGALSDPLKGIVNLPDGLTRRMGMNNDFSIETANYLIRNNKLPDFLYVYLPDLDKKIHKQGPSPKLKGVQELDRQLQTLLDSFGSPEQALQKAVIIVLGDSGMTRILPQREDSVIELRSLFRGYNVLQPGDKVTDETEAVLAVNETMAYVYNLKSDELKPFADILKTDPRIGFISWKERDWIHVMQGGGTTMLRFRKNGSLIDPYRQKWSVEQDKILLDLKIDAARRQLNYGRYPDVLRRLYGALHSHPGNFLVVTAKPGYELADINSPTHPGGGGHGAFGQAESLVPLIISGTEKRPPYLRMVDLKDYLINLVTQ
ncbi:alkaline phosphatase family protein [Paenibacillus sanfengchensis]|uniref:alkaline phosphatase family protein n=1 Tax=Paenibacillus sanfengchensis TaxID=3119819 RepID=UPI002FE28376